MDRDWLKISWKLDVFRGVIGVLFGIAAMVWPVETVTALAVLWGIWALFDGASALVLAFLGPAGASGASRVWLALIGVVALVAAFFAIANPAGAVTALMWILGVWLIIRGVLEIIGAFGVGGGMPMWLMLLAGLLSGAIGVLFVWRPGGSAVSLAVLLGAIAAVWGVVLVVSGLRTRHELNAPRGAHVATA
jgi:uncharacterized membrane protein HdeD (DUF308 family)